MAAVAPLVALAGSVAAAAAAPTSFGDAPVATVAANVTANDGVIVFAG
eukprot:COSAG02_NODE_2664_length_8297_cov_22.601244_3_plen_48_part_00